MVSDNSKRRSGQRLPLALKILIIAAVTALMSVLALTAAVFAVARGSDSAASEKLCATMTERRFLLTGLFFTSSEINAADFYRPVREAEDYVIPGTLPVKSTEGTVFQGKGWSGQARVFGAGTVTPKLADGQVPGQFPASLGLEGGLTAVFRDDCLVYAGEGGEELYCVVACDGEGKLHIGGKTVAEIANSGYTWAVSADRVLVSGGKPCTGLGGGYAPRAAIGQTADGDTVIFCAQSASVYPCGITFDEAAAIMYGLGCVNAAALSPAGALKIGGENTVYVGGKTAYTILLAGREAE